MKYFVERKCCPACSGSEISVLYSADFSSPEIKEYLNRFYGRQGGIEWEFLADAQYVLAECTTCSLIFQKNIGTDQLMERLYEHWIDPQIVFKEEVQQLGLPYYLNDAHEIVNVISHFQTLPANLSFLDFGMGWGKWSLLAKAFGCQSYGSELSQQRIDYARGNGVVVLSYDEIKNQKFDFINSEQVFEHISQPLDTLRDIRKSLKPHGIIKISVPDAEDIRKRIAKMDWRAEKWTPDSLNAVAPLEHINSFNSRSLLRMAQEAGLTRVNIPFYIPPMRMRSGRSTMIEKTEDVLRLLFPNSTGGSKPGTYMFFKVSEQMLQS